MSPKFEAMLKAPPAGVEVWASCSAGQQANEFDDAPLGVFLDGFRLALTPDGGSSAFLERMIGPARALELLFTNRRLSAREAHAWELVNEVVEDGQLLDRAVAFAAGLQHVPGYVLLETRRLLDTVNIRNQLQLESVAIRSAARGVAFRDALKAFVAAHPG